MEHVEHLCVLILAPGTGDDSNFMAQVLRPLLGSATHVDVPKLRKLYFEAYTMESWMQGLTKMATK